MIIWWIVLTGLMVGKLVLGMDITYTDIGVYTVFSLIAAWQVKELINAKNTCNTDVRLLNNDDKSGNGRR